MEVVRATWKNGRIEPDGPVDWPEGCRLVIEPETTAGSRAEMDEDDWSNSPEAIADWLAWYDSLEPLEFTPEERADLVNWRQKVKEYTIAHMHKAAEGLFE